MHSRSHSPCWLRFAVFVLFLFGCKAASIASVTPVQIKDNNCRANATDLFLSMHCLSLEDENALKVVLANLTDSALILEVSHLHWDTFSLSSFQNVSLHTLIVANSSFRSFHNSDHTSVQSLHHLSFENITFQESPHWKDFAVVSKLQVLSIYNTTLTSSINSSFGHHLSKSVESITITESNITHIEADSFRELKNLTYLRISHNKLKSFPKLILTSGTRLEQLRLDYNRIHSLPSGVFDNLPNLKVLSLSNNTISTLPEEVFSPLWRSDAHVELRDNPIKCDCRILWTVTSQTKPRNIVGQCSHPKHLYGRNLKDLTAKDLNC